MNIRYFPGIKESLFLMVLFLPVLLVGQDCVDETIAALPFNVSSSTCGMGNDITVGNVCNSWEMSGEDITYSYTTGTEECMELELSGFPTGAAGVIVTSGCPNAGGSECVTSASSGFNATSLSATFYTEPNTTYYFSISSDDWDAACIDYDFSLNSDCPAPNTGDCLGAINICEDYYYEENAPDGSGNFVDNIAATDCGAFSMDNVGWYTLTVQTAGVLNFTLSPLEVDDYDWQLFNLTGASCAELATNADLLVSCNTYGEIGNNGETGISTANGGTGTANGPGNTNGPPFNEDLNVEVGETYVLVVSNWSGTPNGYELDFSASTATFIDDIPPEVEQVSTDCNGIKVEFSEYIDCTTALPGYFNVEGPGGPYTVTELESACTDGFDHSLSFDLVLDTPFPGEGGDFELVFNESELADMCGNFLEPVSIPFVIQPGMELETTTVPAACGNDNGALEIEVVSGGTAPFTYAIDGDNFQAGAAFTNLAAGDYTVTVRDDAGCTTSLDVTVPADVIDFTAGEDTYSCQLSYAGEATLPDGYTGEWTAPAGVQMSDTDNPNCIFSPSEAGSYTFTWTITNGTNCTVDQSVDVVFNAIEVSGLSILPPTCFDQCDASAEATVSGVADMAALEYEWSGGTTSPATPGVADELCPGMNTLTLRTGEGCTLDYPFEIANPDPIAIDSVIVNEESCPDFCDGSIVIESAEASTFSFDGGLTFSSSKSADQLCAGSYRLVLKNADQCQVDTTVNLMPPKGPEALIRVSPLRQSTFTPHFQFENQSDNYLTSYWQFDYPNGADFSHKDDPAYTYSNPEVGDYTVMLVATDSKGCVDTTFRTVGIYEDTWIYIPSSFTPNGDGLNDIFRPVISNVDVDDYSLEIFNRWGEAVFQTTDIDKGWNGSVSGSGYFGEAGSYSYHIHIREQESGDRREWNGSLMLIR